MTVRFGSRCGRVKPDGAACMTRTSGGDCGRHEVAVVAQPEPAPVEPCAVAICSLPAVAGERDCRAHARVMVG